MLVSTAGVGLMDMHSSHGVNEGSSHSSLSGMDPSSASSASFSYPHHLTGGPPPNLQVCRACL